MDDALKRWLAPLGAALPTVYLVGGAVRDRLMGRAVKDIDLMTARPHDFGRRLAGIHNAALVPFVKKIDAPCYRVVNRANPNDFLDLVPIHGGSVAADLARRDFTINAMAMEVGPGGRFGRLIDPVGGQDDIEGRRLRMTTTGVFSADPLRILRAVRFSGEFGFTVEPGTLSQMQSAMPALAGVSGERVWSEMRTILSRNDSRARVRLMDRLGVFATLFPETVAMRGCTQNAYHHLDVWDHCLETMAACEIIVGDIEKCFGESAPMVRQCLDEGERRVILKLAALFHDIGKPGARRTEEGTGKIIFYGHDRDGARKSVAIADRLRLSARQRDLLALLIEHHMHVLFLAKPQVREKTVLRWFRRLGDATIPLMILSMADVQAGRGPATPPEARVRHRAWAAATVDAYCSTIRKAISEKSFINGNDLIALGMRPGPELGRILSAVRTLQDTRTVSSRKEALAAAANQIKAFEQRARNV